MVPQLNIGTEIRKIARESADQYAKYLRSMTEMRRLLRIKRDWEALTINAHVSLFTFFAIGAIIADFWLGWPYYSNLAACSTGGNNAPTWAIFSMALVVNSFIVYTASLLAKSHIPAIQRWYLYNKVYIEHSGEYALGFAKIEQNAEIQTNKHYFKLSSIVLTGVVILTTMLRLLSQTAAKEGNDKVVEVTLSASDWIQIVMIAFIIGVELIFSIYMEYLIKKITLNWKTRKAITAHNRYHRKYRELDEVVFSLYCEARDKGIRIDLSADLEAAIARVSGSQDPSVSEEKIDTHDLVN